MAIELERIGWEDGTLVSNAKVNVQGTIYEVEPEQYSGSTPLSAENLKAMEDNTENAINEVDDKLTDVDAKYESEIIYARPSSDFSINGDAYISVNNLKKDNGAGDNLTISSGQIKIGAGISKVKVNARLQIFSESTTVFYSFISKNNVNVVGTRAIQKKEGNSDISLYNQCLLDVQENDLISVRCYAYEGAKVVGESTIIVEKIA